MGLPEIAARRFPPLASFARFSVAKKGLVLVTVPLLFHLLFIVMMAAVEWEHRRQRAGELRQRQVITAAYRLLGLMVDAETGMRGYVLGRNEIFLEPYRSATTEFPRQFAQLRTLAGNDAEAPPLNELAATGRVALEYEASAIAKVREGQSEDAVSRINKLEGKQRVDAFRAAVQRFLDAERKLASATEARSENAQAVLYVILVSCLGIDIMLATMLSVFFTRGITRRLAAVTENTRRVERQELLSPPLAPGDEIASLDARLHEMAATIDAARSGLEEANSELAAFSYSISHDLRAPVRAVDGYSRMLEEDYGSHLDGEGARYLATIRSEARRMGCLIDDLLAFSKLTRTNPQETDIDMTELVREVVEELRSERPDTTAEFRIDDVLPAHGDRAMLRQVFVNFISNAVKFSAPAAKPVVEIGGERCNGENVYWVRDNGVGFDMRYAAKLFGVFQRLHKFDEFEGTGVGLAIAQRVITRHEGRVWAESSLGKGASFFFTLPNVSAAHGAREERS